MFTTNTLKALRNKNKENMIEQENYIITKRLKDECVIFLKKEDNSLNISGFNGTGYVSEYIDKIYDEVRRLIKEIQDEDNQLIKKVELQYDNHQLVIGEKRI